MKKKVVVLGSTGSIGRQTLDVLAAFPDDFEVLALCAQKNAAQLLEQAKTFNPEYIGLADEDAAKDICSLLPAGVVLEAGEGVAAQLAALPEADIVINGLSGLAGLLPLLASLEAGKTVGLANKESIVCGYPLVKRTLDQFGGHIIPVDSEHSAIFQCLQNGTKEELSKIILTASGGPFFGMNESELREVTPEQAVKHPVWSMGAKISIDSATLFNKGLEVIEAAHFFQVQNSQISVLIHPQSIVHSMVEYMDGAVIAQLAAPDMRLAVQYALTYPERKRRQIAPLRLDEVSKLTFYSGDDHPAIRLAYHAVNEGKSMPVVYHAADDVAVELFCARRIGFLDIQKAVDYALEHVPKQEIRSLEDILHVDRQTRNCVNNLFGLPPA
ncbi:1-deoxy-D-xylulose-5-phosphate reductoisomerase [Eubacteriales bacterium OttesenSCG-928-K08]|nr:1-deoxy-D-xylulose-5-phosphate reductoisomerase [Eubacteriales bacterium OttesenSCG-928-K08]